ncbi:S1/P1 Nuclease [Phytophthora infestans]|uniref:S1/P1 Nuclease n=1 Tax=Phytophthora infestans TaxID=4787 RepID=A0A833WF05_PHYIN|nr:S1/P1 Nuclease [Phytophthora infestans]
MKIAGVSLTVTAVASTGFLPTTQGWWDNGHMLVGEMAKQLLDEADVTTIESILSRWDEDFPNTGEITTTAVWMDIVKCTAESSTCLTPASPSITSISDWHYINLPLHINGDKWEDKDTDLTLYDDIMGGDGISVIEGVVKSFNRQPLPAQLYPHLRRSTSAAPHSRGNPHAVWDAAGGLYSLNKWSLNIDSFRPTLENASELIALLPSVQDNITFSQYVNVTYNELNTALVTNQVLREVALETYNFANTIVYSNLDLNATSSGTYPCPSASYLAMVGEISQKRIAIAGSRLAVVLKHFAAQLRVLGLHVAN